jgi:Flp pilus assembly protein TadB
MTAGAHTLGLVAACSSLAIGARGIASYGHRRDERHAGGPPPEGADHPSRPDGAIRRLGRRYDSSIFGRRLEPQLWAAQVELSPAGWRCAQLLVAIPLGTVLAAAGVSGTVAATAALSMTRAGGRIVLWLCRRRSRDAIAAASPLIARSLATELAAWGSGPHAVLRASARCRGVSAARRVTELAAARVALGAEPAPSLQRALDQVEPGLRNDSPSAAVVSVFALYRYDAGATAAALERLAAAIEDERTVRREARAAVGEVRMSSVAVPAIAVVTGGMLLSADPPALAAALSIPLFPLLLGAVVIVMAAAVAARRLVSI